MAQLPTGGGKAQARTIDLEVIPPLGAPLWIDVCSMHHNTKTVQQEQLLWLLQREQETKEALALGELPHPAKEASPAVQKAILRKLKTYGPLL